MKKKILVGILFTMLLCTVLMLTGCKEAPDITIVSVEKTTTSISFDISVTDNDNICEITKIELLHGEDEPIVADDVDVKEFTGLLSDNEYTIRVTYTYKGFAIFNETDSVQINVRTTAKNKPDAEVLNLQAGIKDVTLDLNKENLDNIDFTLTNAEIYLGETKVKELTSFENVKFEGLLSNTEYTVKISYTYDLNDGKGTQSGEISKKITTAPIPEPVILLGVSNRGDTSAVYNAEVKTSFTTYEFVKAELIHNGIVVATSNDENSKTFDNLAQSKKYKIKVYYTYDTNSSEGSREFSQEREFVSSMFSSQWDIKTDWADEEILIAATSWNGSPAHPWSTMEIVIKDGEASGWGEKIDKAVLERTAFIKETYGVDVVWEWSSRYNTSDVLKTALKSNYPNYTLAMPRTFRAQSIVADGSVYDMANREYIDFDNEYYNADSVKTYTAKGHTFFIAGDFANLDKETAQVLYFNKTLLGDEAAVDNLYKKVREGKWTFEELIALANSRYEDNGNAGHDDYDIYGLSVASLSRFYEFFGVRQAGVDESTGDWKITLNDPKVNDIVSAIITANTANWVRSNLGGAWSTNANQAFINNKILFLNDTINESVNLEQVDNLGIVPFPMLNEAQGRYYAPYSGQYSTLMCVPKTTSDRDMSDYFIDVLAWTGRDYVMDAYYKTLATRFDSETEMEMIKEYIIPNICCDAGDAVGWGSLMGNVLSSSYVGNVNNFAQSYADAEAGALATIRAWNDAWGAYTE